MGVKPGCWHSEGRLRSNSIGKALEQGFASTPMSWNFSCGNFGLVMFSMKPCWNTSAASSRYRIGLLSNAFGNLRSYLTEVLKIATLFDHIVISAEVGITKPEAGIYTIALEGLGVLPHEAVFIDDFERNVSAAQQLGMHALHFRDPQTLQVQLESILGG